MSLQKVPPEMKILGLYLMDSVMKNHKYTTDYNEVFEKRILPLFIYVFENVSTCFLWSGPTRSAHTYTRTNTHTHTAFAWVSWPWGLSFFSYSFYSFLGACRLVSGRRHGYAKNKKLFLPLQNADLMRSDEKINQQKKIRRK